MYEKVHRLKGKVTRHVESLEYYIAKCGNVPLKLVGQADDP